MPAQQPQPHVTILTTPPFHKAWLATASLFVIGGLAILYGKQHEADRAVLTKQKRRKA
jgi:hypothetical protein